MITIGEYDSRVIYSGCYMRKYKLDEFSQLVVSFAGDMSLVGFCLEVRKYMDRYTSEQMYVLNVRSEITDFASI